MPKPAPRPDLDAITWRATRVADDPEMWLQAARVLAREDVPALAAYIRQLETALKAVEEEFIHHWGRPRRVDWQVVANSMRLHAMLARDPDNGDPLEDEE